MKKILIGLRCDIHRYFSIHPNIARFKYILILPLAFHNPGIIFSIIFRSTRYFLFHSNLLFTFIGYALYPIYFLIIYYLLDINVDIHAHIDSGVYIHNRGVIIGRCHIGKNATIIGSVTIGYDLNPNIDDFPKIGNNVTICTGSRIIGKLTIGNNAIIGANAVVVKNVKSNSVVGGVPAKIIKP